MPSLSECACASCRRYRGEDDVRERTDCAQCGYTYYRENGYDEDDDFCDAACYRDYHGYYDEDDVDEGGDTGDGPYVHNYSFTPDLQFRRLDDDPDPELFLGWELEVPSSQSNALATAIYDGPGQQEEVLYCKEDGSITGVEIVSHPMTHAWMRENFDWSMFRPSSPVSQHVAGTPGSGYGLHVHVSRKGFRNEAHALRWLLMIYRNEELTELVARRRSDQWAGFRDKAECIKKATGKRGRAEVERYRADLVRYGYTPDYITEAVREYMESGSYDGERYVAVNAQNQHTFEVRVFRSTWDEAEFRAALDYVHATVTYTRRMRAADALRGGLTAASFVDWLQDKPEYTALAVYLANRMPDVNEDGVTLSA